MRRGISPAWTYRWHIWFAWHPVQIGNEWVWLEKVWRMEHPYSGIFGGGGIYSYSLLEIEP